MNKLSDTDLLLFLELEERSEDPCEHRDHGQKVGGIFHTGPGEWLIYNTGHGCRGEEYKLVCDRFKKTLIDPDRTVQCSCGTVWNPSSQYTVLGRKGVDF